MSCSYLDLKHQRPANNFPWYHSTTQWFPTVHSFFFFQVMYSMDPFIHYILQLCIFIPADPRIGVFMLNSGVIKLFVKVCALHTGQHRFCSDVVNYAYKLIWFINVWIVMHDLSCFFLRRSSSCQEQTAVQNSLKCCSILPLLISLKWLHSSVDVSSLNFHSGHSVMLALFI